VFYKGDVSRVQKNEPGGRDFFYVEDIRSLERGGFEQGTE
jgi:hypothetical protein